MANAGAPGAWQGQPALPRLPCPSPCGSCPLMVPARLGLCTVPGESVGDLSIDAVLAEENAVRTLLPRGNSTQGQGGRGLGRGR